MGQMYVEISFYGVAFIAKRTSVEHVRGLRFKLWIMVIPILGPTFMFQNNTSVLIISSIPDSMLKNETSYIAYHYVRKSCIGKDKNGESST